MHFPILLIVWHYNNNNIPTKHLHWENLCICEGAHFHIQKLVFLSIFCWYFLYFVFVQMICLSAYMYRKISIILTKLRKSIMGWGGAPPLAMLVLCNNCSCVVQGLDRKEGKIGIDGYIFPHPLQNHSISIFKLILWCTGATYEDGTSGKDKEDDAIPPGASHTYRWEVPERAGPADPDHNCIPWIYHSHIESTFEMNSGLTGFILACRNGKLRGQSYWICH